jgi:lysozyme family protein
MATSLGKTTMIPDTERIIDELIDREGKKFTNRPSDRGGPTKFGVTLLTLQLWRGHAVTALDVENLTEDEARQIYHAMYITWPKFHLIKDPMVMMLVIDAGVQHGVNRATRWLQELVKVPEDGKIGPMTEQAINSVSGKWLYYAFLARRIQFYGYIIAHDPARKKASEAGYELQAEHAYGWANRVSEFVQEV